MALAERNMRQKGRAAEDRAIAYLEQLGLKFVTRNWYNGHTELDIIMEDDAFIRFIEVRSLEYPHSVEPFETVDIRKQRHIIRAAGRFIAKYKIEKEAVFDIVSVILKDGNFNIKYIANAFTPLW